MPLHVADEGNAEHRLILAVVGAAACKSDWADPAAAEMPWRWRPRKMPPGCSTNRNHTAGLPLSPRFSQRPATVGSAARACGMKVANAANADKTNVASFAVTLEILPIRQPHPTQADSIAP